MRTDYRQIPEKPEAAVQVVIPTSRRSHPLWNDELFNETLVHD